MKHILFFSLVFSSLASAGAGQLQAGQRVIDAAEDTGTVLAVFPQGKALINWDAPQLADSLSLVHSLSPAVKCSGKLCQGDRVLDSSNDLGRATEIFANGRVKVDWDDPQYLDSITRLHFLGFSD